jgi:uncharacterized protein YggE
MAVGASAQDVFYTIESEGSATVDVAPTNAEFIVTAAFTGGTVTEAMDKAQKFEPQLREQFTNRNLQPTTINFGGAAIEDMQKKQVRVTARIQFPSSAFNAPDNNGPLQFAGLCDNVMAAAAAVQADVTGPVLGVEDPAAVQQTAIQRAMERAYPSAKAAADIMNGQIVAVGKVNVQGLAWNDTGGSPAALPDSRRITCTAHIRVTYLYSSGG